MTDHTSNISCQYGIEKYEGSFEQDDLGVTQIPSESIRSIKNFTDLALFTYLASCSKDWRLNAKQLAAHFGCNKDKIYKSIDSLIEQGFLSRTCIRNKGKFAKFHYRLHLRPVKPVPELPVLEKPDTVNPDAYKTYKVKNIKEYKNTYVDSEKSTEYSEDDLFMLFYSGYPNKQQPRHAYKCFLKLKPTRELVEMLCEDIKKRIANNWRDRPKDKIPHPATYLNRKEWEGEIITPGKNIAGTKLAQYDHDDTSWIYDEGL